MKVLGIDFSCALGALANGHFPEKDCLLPLISKLLGYAIVAASTTIMKILQNGSVRGLSIVAFELEVVGYTIALAYCLHKGLPFSAYGELAFLLIQAIILVAIIYYYSQPVGMKTWIRALLYCALAPTILAGQIDPILFEALYASQHAIFLCAKIPQIWANFSGAQLLNQFHEFWRFYGESFYQHPRSSTKKRFAGLCNWHCNKCYPPESDNYIPEAEAAC
ncbi:mannose-P-dolichol utilization defect 1 protein homolog 2 [Prunus yedoensis var. nudiflora]|uniref:Mannose-P-dolichol utilization defect 1 protein homolog 2 n=1 Tax=Prunus yedoensis var. nudiflora TaxID=2094558 RepID=A0A314YJQ2_PRUYE|nr:mannose-P-dolichol utilization defect 1 protein homolog 2 [Prunus yedoensis var. nudiflora]